MRRSASRATGPEVTPQLIQQVLAPLVPPAAKEALAAGRVRHNELGRIRTTGDEAAAGAERPRRVRRDRCLMNDTLLDLVKRKVVEPREAYGKAVDKAGLKGMFEVNGIVL